MVELQQEWRASGFEQPFQMRIGINTGYCNVDNFGSGDRLDYTIIGAEVNHAAQVQAAADPGGILISYPTWALVRDIVGAEERSSIAAKGIRRGPAFLRSTASSTIAIRHPSLARNRAPCFAAARP
jgi:adenylate cyclase